MMADELDLVKAQEIWALRLLDVERLNQMYQLWESVKQFYGMTSKEAQSAYGWIDEYWEMMRVRDSEVVVRHEVMSKPVEPDYAVEREHLGRVALIDAIAADVYRDADGDLAGVVRESCYKADFKDWIETRLQGWYIERFQYDDLDVEFLTAVREAIYGVEP